MSFRRTRTHLTALVVLGASLALAAEAPATTTIGQTAPLYSPQRCDLGNLLVQIATAAEPGYAVPAGGGTITSWSTEGGNEIGALQLKIVRPLPGGQYTVVGESPAQDIFPQHFNTFALSPGIPVQAGDLLGLVQTAGKPGCVFRAPVGGVTLGDTLLATDSGIVPPAGTAFGPYTTVESARLDVSATVEPPATAPSSPDSPATTPPALGAATSPGEASPLPTAAVSALRLSPRRFAAGRRHGTKVSFTLSEAADVRFTVSHRRGGFTRHGAAGANAVRFSGRLAGRRLKPGTYTLIATPRANGITGRSVRARFRIVAARV